MFYKRSEDLEIIDLKNYSKEEYELCLKTLDRVGRWLGGDAGTFAALDRMKTEPKSILDVGCGGGIFTSRLALQYPQAKIVGIDVNRDAIAFAKKNVNLPTNISYESRNQGQLIESPKSYDVVMSTLVCHHLSDEQIIDFLQRATNVAKKKVIINDLHRNPLAYYLFKLVSPICFRNRLVEHDGPLSVLRSFKRKDWEYYLEKAGVRPTDYRIRWRWAFRWLIEIECEGCSND
jgi:2-polyprenyl-3-methyl-5-hydroxy-6-metoxy-1,4-benzoquinol methylase